MGKIFSYLSVFIFCLSGTMATAQTSKMLIEEPKMELRLIDTVKFNADTDIKSVEESKWLEMNISYKLPRLMENSAEKWLDDVDVECEILMPTTYKGKSGVYAYLTGKFVYWSIPCDGKMHYEKAFVPPQILRRYKKAGEKIKKEMLKEIYAKITFYTKDRKMIGEIYAGPKGKSDDVIKAIFKKVSEPGALVINVENVIIPRNKSPWAVLNYDYYDIIKDDVRK